MCSPLIQFFSLQAIKRHTEHITQPINFHLEIQSYLSGFLVFIFSLKLFRNLHKHMESRNVHYNTESLYYNMWHHLWVILLQKHCLRLTVSTLIVIVYHPSIINTCTSLLVLHSMCIFSYTVCTIPKLWLILLRVEAIYTKDRSPVYHKSSTQYRQTTIHTHIVPTGNLESPINLSCISGLWEETGIPGGNPRRQEGNMWTSHRKASENVSVAMSHVAV